jgi:hypothetical protein
MFMAPAHVVKHDGLMQSFFEQEPFHDFHGDEIPLIRFRAGDDQIAVRFRPASGIEQSFAEIAGRQHRQETELVLPSQAIGLKLRQQVQDGEIHGQLKPRGT